MKNLKFIRFGGLSSVRQKGYSDKDRGFHTPPVRKGIFAFVHGFQEYFLLSGSFSKLKTKHSKFQWVKDHKGNKVKYTDDLMNSSNYFIEEIEGECYLVKPVDPKVFSYKGEIWHHLPVKPNEVLSRSGSWVKTDYLVFVKAFQKEIGKMKAERARNGYSISRDHLEVFIEKV